MLQHALQNTATHTAAHTATHTATQTIFCMLYYVCHIQVAGVCARAYD